MINHRIILKKYLSFLIDREGSSLLHLYPDVSSFGKYGSNRVSKLTEKEIAELERIEKELRGVEDSDQ